jgi:hypothetical protein
MKVVPLSEALSERMYPLSTMAQKKEIPNPPHFYVARPFGGACLTPL